MHVPSSILAVLSVAVDNSVVWLYSRLGFEVARADGAALTMIKRLSSGVPTSSSPRMHSSIRTRAGLDGAAGGLEAMPVRDSQDSQCNRMWALSIQRARQR